MDMLQEWENMLKQWVSKNLPFFYSPQRRSLRHETYTVEIETAAELIECSYWIERTPLRLMVPTEMLRMQGGFIYGKDHPFVQALTHGTTALKQFYDSVQPASLSDYYGIESHDRIGCGLPAWELPWYKRSARTPPRGEAGLSAEHGVSYFGPVTSQKIKVELDRLKKVTHSIQKKGFTPEKNGDIEGYILKSGDNACFFVRGGKHRAAALAYLGHNKIPVVFRRTFPRVVDVASSKYWPLVMAGLMDISFAQEIMDFYIKGRSMPCRTDL
ncbi:MAG: hypothetical protein A2X80_12295 [Geobacteraceae bacterium GWB2_52_12]|nr:MAG: hypothetical protein A2X80_12295 [Geobacteraceae bacterium GWB2_52_12]